MRSAAEHAYWRDRVTAATVRALDRQRQRMFAATSAAATLVVPKPRQWDPLSWDDDVDEEVRPEADAAVQHAVQSVMSALPSLAALFATLGGDRSQKIVDGARSLGNGLAERIASVPLTDPDYAQRVSDYFDGAVGSAANVGTMATHAGNGIAADASTLAAEQGFSLEKTWNTVGDDAVRETHDGAEGQTVDASEPFEIGDDLLMYPGDPDGSDEETMGCRCWLTFTGYGTENTDVDAESLDVATAE